MAAAKIAFRPLDQLTPDPRNARTHSTDQIGQIAASIRRFGWTNPVIADEMIRAGHGRCAAARLIYDAGERLFMAPGEANGGASIPDGQVPVIDCTGWTEEERRAYALGDNQLALQAGWDPTVLLGEIEALVATGFDLEVIGFDPAALAALEESANGGDAGGGGSRAPGGEMADTDFVHVDQYAVIVRCADATEQEARFVELREKFGADNVKVVVV
jgi:hypothetical protein